MRTMSECIEEAAAFTDFRDRLLADDKRVRAAMSGDTAAPSDGNEPPLDLGRQPGENRAQHRARLKAERRAAAKVCHGQR